MIHTLTALTVRETMGVVTALNALTVVRETGTVPIRIAATNSYSAFYILGAVNPNNVFIGMAYNKMFRVFHFFLNKA